MKQITFLFIMIIAIITPRILFAQYAKVSEIQGNSSVTVYAKEVQCGQDCIKIPVGFNKAFHTIQDEEIDDIEKPVYSKTEVESCLDADDCQAKLVLKTCSGMFENKIKNIDTLELYCSKFLRYEKKLSGSKIVQEDATLKTLYETQLAQKKAIEGAIQLAMKAQNCGRRVQALLAVRNVQKNLTKAQKRQIVNAYAEIKNLLDSGSLDTAREDILAVNADGILVTESDKTALVAELDSCK